ncbi:MAG: type II toxin-antitoxin system RelE/ParE family toxin [Bacteroidetes bacterium]|nr:type II toxin-antitoxin system RelE/ParE family toxin [Bacteroidota bacterium]
MLPYIFTENAMADMIKQAMYYEDKEKGLGLKFMNEITLAAEEVSKMPKAFVSSYKNTRERKAKHFPYKLIYTLEEGIIYIHAVYACKANPKNKYNRMKK